MKNLLVLQTFLADYCRRVFMCPKFISFNLERKRATRVTTITLIIKGFTVCSFTNGLILRIKTNYPVEGGEERKKRLDS